jgi:hypothetical protein
MASTDIHASFDNGNTADVAGVTINEFTGPAAGQLVTPAPGNNNLLQEDGSETTVTASLSVALVADSDGQVGGADAIETAMFAEMAYAFNATQAIAQLTISAPDILRATLVSGHGTGYSSQDVIEVACNSETPQNVVATDNLGKATFVDIEPVAGEFVVTMTNNSSGNDSYAAWNFFQLLDVVYAVTYNITANHNEAGDTQSGVIQTDGGISNITANHQEEGDIQAGFIGSYITITQKSLFSDDFSVDGPLDSSWEIYNGSALPNVQVVNGQYNSGSITEVGTTTWYNGDRGQAIFKDIDIPDSGYVEIRLYNTGLGPSTDPAANLPYQGAGQGAFGAGLIVHDQSLATPHYEFALPTHRLHLAGSSIESKRTENGNSTDINDEGHNVVGDGVTKIDQYVRIYSDEHLEWAFRPVGGSTWTLIQEGTAHPGRPASGQLTWSSRTLKVGIICYAFNAVPIAFTGTADGIELVGELTGFEEGDTQSGTIQTQLLSQITANHVEAEETQSGDFEVVNRITANHLEANEIIIGSFSPFRYLTANFNELGDLQSGSLTVTSPSDTDLFEFPPFGGITEFSNDNVIPTYRKDPDSLVNYWFSIQDLIGDLTIASAQLIGGSDMTSEPVQVNESQLTVGTKTYKPNSVMAVQLSGGTLRARYELTFRFTLNSGETDDRSVYIEVLNK